MAENESYIIKKLNEGIPLKIIFMAHNAYWPYVEQLAFYYGNCQVQVFGKGTAYLEMSPNNMPMDDCDLLILYGSEYSDYDYTKMVELARKTSKENSKVVTVGYSFAIPSEQKVEFSRMYGLKFVRVNGSIEDEEVIAEAVDITPLDLVNLTLLRHDEITKQNPKLKR